MSQHSPERLRAFALQLKNARPGDTLHVRGQAIPVMAPSLATANDVLVCMRGTLSKYFPASEIQTGVCAQCHFAIHWKKTAPRAPIRVCGVCAASELRRNPESMAIAAEEK